ncbi:LOB domain-containing protein 24 [Phtheirospermum japonicum]|uniref:LOB domain-containing protein 24 n=1 Tax=Phtheirospermum japonicum TaxID=374723 RepID=A0A830CD48_9LAMI|nr:LOB domain-containing protein 24 [Phtheirospermum japonicum]
MNSSRFAACKHLRRRCPSDCIFSPYFPSNNPRRFAYVHKIYGASNVGKILQDLPVSRRAEAADTLYYEAYCRIKDPVYGCVGMITILHQQIYNAQCQLARIQGEIVALTTQQHEYEYDHHRVQETTAPHQNVGPNSTSFYDLSTWFD